jgi:hypothetical protein
VTIKERRDSVKELCDVAERFEHHLDAYAMESSERRALDREIMATLKSNTLTISRIEEKIEAPLKYLNDIQGFGRTGRFIGKIVIFIGAVAAGAKIMYVSLTHFKG